MGAVAVVVLWCFEYLDGDASCGPLQWWDLGWGIALLLWWRDWGTLWGSLVGLLWGMLWYAGCTSIDGRTWRCWPWFGRWGKTIPTHLVWSCFLHLSPPWILHGGRRASCSSGVSVSIDEVLSAGPTIGKAHWSVVGSFMPTKKKFPLYLTTHFSSNLTVHPASVSTRIPKREAIDNSGTMCPMRVVWRPGI